MTGSECQEIPLLCVRHITCLTTPNWSLVWLIACSLITFLSFSESFTSSDPLRLLEYSRYKPKTVSYIVPPLPRDARETEADVDNLQTVFVWKWQTDKEEQSEKDILIAAQHFSTAPGQQAVFHRGTEIEYQGLRCTLEDIVLKLLSCCSRPFLKLW